MAIMPSTSPDSLHPAPGRRLWFLLGVGLLVVIALLVVQLQSELERNTRSWLSAAIVALGLLLGLLWFAFLSRFPGRVRLAGVAAVTLLGLVLSQVVRVAGTISSIGFPRLAWRWTQEQGPALAPVAATLPATAAPAGAVAAGLRDVSQFFGPQRDGVITGAQLARDWGVTPPRELWRQAMGAGWSAFAVVGGWAFTQEQRGDVEVIAAYEVLTGRLLWSHTNPVRFDQWQGGPGPRATPTVAGGRVFAYGATGILDCLDAATGKRIWTHQVLTANNGVNLEWGLSASPLVFDDTVVVTGGEAPGPTLLAFRAASGEPLWHSGKARASYASPSLVTLAGRRLVLNLNDAALTAHDPATGAVLLDHSWTSARTPKAAQPVVLADDRIFLSAGYGVGCALLQIKATAAGGLEASQVWKNMRMKNQFNTVAARGGFLYGLDDGTLACVEIATGERRWKAGRYASGQTLLVDDLILIQAESGEVALAEARPEGYRELGRIPALSSKTWNHPTLAGRFLLVRNDREAVAFELPAATAPGRP